MSLRTVLSVAAVLAVLFGLSFLFVPVPTLALYDVGTVSPRHAYAAQWFGAALVSLGVLDWAARDVTDPVGRRAVVLGNLVHAAIGVVLGLLGVLQGTVGAFGWSTVVIYALLAAGFGAAVPAVGSARRGATA
ncbi:MAG TPA: hypothetical protein VEA81_09005 [Burkholderiaceae bacterium]|nr:hypothetical protein [Burkholderiaceae bacterium]